MRRLIILSLTGILCLPVSVYALSIGGTETQGKGKFAIGVEDEYVPYRDLKNLSVSNRTYIKKDDVEVDEMFRKMLKISYGLFDGLDIYGKVGLSDFEVADFKLKDDIPVNFKADSKPGFTYGGGIRANLNIGNNWLIGTDAQYLRHRNSVWNYNIASQNDPLRGRTEGKMTVQEWHGALYLARKVENFTPYLGGKYSDLRMKLKYVEGDSDNFGAEDRFGVFLGTDIKVGNFIVNLEGRFVDETAVSLGISYRF